MFKCPECGYLGFEEEKKCPKCGTDVSPVEGVEDTNSIMSPPAEIEEEKIQEETSKERTIETPEQIDEVVQEKQELQEKEAETINEEVKEETETPEIAPGESNFEIAMNTETEKKQQVYNKEQELKDKEFLLPEKEIVLSFQNKKPIQQDLPISHKPEETQEELSFQPSFLSRASAFVIDTLLITGITLIFLMLSIILTGSVPLSLSDFGKVSFLPFYFLYVIFHLLYHTYFFAITGQTPGKALFNLKVVGRGGLKLDLIESLFRSAGYLVSIIPAGIGFIWALIDRNRETWHDKLTHSRVISVHH